jgi:hypothetical protein
MESQTASAEWSHAAVQRALKEQTRHGEPASAQVFFVESIEANDLRETASRVIEETASSLGKPEAVAVGKIRVSARSVSVSGDADVIAAVQQRPEVKAVLPNIVDDILPRPTTVRPYP